MNTALWLVQIILAIKLITTSLSHGLRQNQPAMKAALEKLGGAARLKVSLTAILTFACAAAMILPGLLTDSFFITSVAAGIIAVMLLISLVCHIRSREKPKVFVSFILWAFAIFVAYGRWILVP